MSAEAYVRHVVANASRQHVPWWSAAVDDQGNLRADRHCLCSRCEINRDHHLRRNLETKDAG